MKILLDQSAQRNLVPVLHRHKVEHTAQLGWEEIANEKLLKLAEDGGYPLLITADQNMPYQNSMTGRSIAILYLSTNNWNLMKAHVASIAEAVEEVRPGEIKNLFCGKFVPSKFRRTPNL